MLKYHNDILFPIIEKHDGVLVKTMGDGTMSYFDDAQHALRAGAEIQVGIDEFNLKKILERPIFIRVGIHSGTGIVEENDIFGDVVNTASRFESIANPGEIYLSEQTYDELTDKSEIYCRFIKTTALKGKKDPVKVYKAFWNPEEVEKDINALAAAPKENVKSGRSLPSWFAAILIVAIFVLFILFNTTNLFNIESPEDKRSKTHSVTIPAGVDP
jgi:adenylate cyclase